MKIQQLDIRVYDLVWGYQNDGETSADNCQMLCRKCNREKSAK